MATVVYVMFDKGLNPHVHKSSDLSPCVISLTSDMIFLYQLAQARPHNVLHFLVAIRWDVMQTYVHPYP